MIIFYFIFKLKNKKFEIFICIVPFVFLLFLFLRYSNIGRYDNGDVLFSIRKVLKPHSLFVSYFFGSMIGIIYFINNYTLVLVEEKVYLPFKFFSRINIFLHKRNVYMMRIFSYVFIILAITVSFNFELIKRIYPVEANNSYGDKRISLKWDLLLNFIFIYEQKLFIMFIGLYLILLIHRDNHESKDSNFFDMLVLSRSSYCILLLSDLNSDLVYMKILAWCRVFNNIFFIILFLFANFLLNSLFGVIAHISFETPFRIMIKKINRKKEEIL
jgi:hypothetical protein